MNPVVPDGVDNATHSGGRGVPDSADKAAPSPGRRRVVVANPLEGDASSSPIPGARRFVVANPLRSLDAVLQRADPRDRDPDQILRNRIVVLSEVLKIDPERIRNWGIAQAILSAVWSFEDHGRGWEAPVQTAEILCSLKV